jgi:hypothetical protein
VILTVVLNTLHACVIAFTAVLVMHLFNILKNHEINIILLALFLLQGILEPIHSFILLIFSWYSMWQIFMYCYFGHRIRALHASVLNAAYESRWVQGSEISRSAAIMIATVASCPYSISQIGSPFFSLSMETFTSVSTKHANKKKLLTLLFIFFRLSAL